MRKALQLQKKSVLLFLFFVCWLLAIPEKLQAQQTVSIIWDKETGCLVYDDKRKEFGEDIEPSACVRVCEYSTVTYSLTGNTTGWQSTNWNVAGGTINSQTLTTCTVTWGAAGAATVTATINKTNGTTQTEQICVEIINSPRARFGLMPDLNATHFDGCVQDTFYFVNTSITNGGTALIAYYWEFGDGDTSSEFQPSHNYAQAGNYTVRLTVTNACNCTDTYEMTVRVGEGGFEIICPSVVCDGERASYTVPQDVIDGCASVGYNWSVVGGTIVSPTPYGPQILVDWDNVDANGFGYVSLDATSCNLQCAGISTAQIPVIQSNGTILGESVLCENEQGMYKLPQWPSTEFTWTIDSGSTGAVLVQTQLPNEVIVQTQNASGTITLRATYRNTLLNCGGTATIVITVRPQAIIQGPVALCRGNSGSYTIQGGYSGTFTLSGPSGTTTYTGTTFTPTFNVAGNYTLTVSGSTFCKPGQLTIIVKDKEPTPTAINGPSVACPGVPTAYSVTNTVPGTVIKWAVVGGTIVGSNSGNEITVNFSGSGPYTVQAWRESLSAPNCPSNVLSKTVTYPVVNATVSGPTHACSSTFSNYSVNYAEGEEYSWSISPADAGTVTVGDGTQNVTVLWNEYNGTAYVVLNITKCGVMGPGIPYPVQVITAPIVSLSNPPTQICEGSPVTLTLASTPSLTQGTITWDFGDGTSVTTDHTMPNWLTVTHPYSNSGTANVGYTIHVTVENGNGCFNDASTTHLLTVLPAPVASLSPAGNYAICPTFTSQNITVNIQGGIAATSNIKWYRNNVLQSSGMSTTFTATTLGSYYAVVTGLNGCTTTTNTVTYTNDCIPLPDCNSGQTVTLNTPVNSCGVVTVTGSYTGAPSNIVWYTNVTPVSQSTTNTSGSFTFAESGVYTIFYQVTYGTCIVTRSQNVTVSYMPELKYTVTCGTGGGYSVTLLDNSNYFPGHPINSHIFRVNTTNYSVGTAVSHTVNLMPGTYTLGLTIDGTTSTPCSVSPITLVLPAMPSSAFTSTAPRCEEAVISFTPAQSGLSYRWELRPGVFNLQPVASAAYNPNGIYPVSLTVTNEFGCQTTTTQNLTIIDNLLAGTITRSPANGTVCEGSSVALSYTPNSGTPPANSYQWKRGSTVVATTATYNATISGSYTVTVSTTQGCTFTTPAVNVTIIDLPSTTISGPLAICSGSTFTWSVPDAGTGALYEWRKSPSTTIIGTTRSLVQNLTAVGTHTYSITVRIPNGSGGYCVSTQSQTLTVNPNPATPTITFGSLDCDTYTLELHANASGAGTFTWSNGMSGQTIQVTQGGSYMVTFTNTSGCSSSAQIDVPKDPAIHLWGVPDGCYTFCDGGLAGSTLTGTTQPFAYWEWLFNGSAVDAGANTNVPPLDVNLYGSGTYQLLLNSGLCDRISEEVNIDTTRKCECDIRVKVRRIESIRGDICSYQVILDFSNPYSTPLQVTLTAPNGEGIFVPSTVTINPATTTSVAVVFIPLNSFNGGGVSINVDSLLEGGKLCFTKFAIEFPRCGESARTSRLAQSGESFAKADLIVAPNPANDVVELNYKYAGVAEGDVRTLQIYTLMGVLLETHTPENGAGIWKADLGRYPAGQYLIVMKLNGEVIIQKALIVK
ncbi:PKD domain-containing protein [Flavobacterium sp. Sd200]|uniref:PKD domain-containing protein n=1 Tax=Flavobacterium sp. Sd200 TaxID=2692211 RepID=UPI001370E273|nr:PKD domain-containing protein [Flavobacterium sp. Sd200]MXN90030.1 PKD domain-containing protein [Flavobacterium sp. Sd200]